ncbi:hypothetical protein B0H16DRAFT_1737343 [Mycena metata]|uniref:Uncharacterized protein n=1 Tax=Mycena metata TaxID=1033252 RepID=A0AAD7HKY2_9AGAR|nr:hypothetical protein B0H16DRAFT_1737343 [Mycena metata]
MYTFSPSSRPCLPFSFIPTHPHICPYLTFPSPFPFLAALHVFLCSRISTGGRLRAMTGITRAHVETGSSLSFASRCPYLGRVASSDCVAFVDAAPAVCGRGLHLNAAGAVAASVPTLHSPSPHPHPLPFSPSLLPCASPPPLLSCASLLVCIAPVPAARPVSSSRPPMAGGVRAMARCPTARARTPAGTPPLRPTWFARGHVGVVVPRRHPRAARTSFTQRLRVRVPATFLFFPFRLFTYSFLFFAHLPLAAIASRHARADSFLLPNPPHRIASPTYVPSKEDVLRARASSTAIVETRFWAGDLM